MILNLPAHYSECVVACVMIYVNSAESGWSTSWYPFLIGIIVDHHSSSCLADTLFTVNIQSGGEKITCGTASSCWLTFFFFFFTFKTTNVKAILQATCWTSTFLNIKPSGLWHFTCMCSFWKAVVQTDRLTTKKSRRHSLLLALFPLTDFFTLLFPHHQPWILIKCHSHIQSFLQRAKNLE